MATGFELAPEALTVAAADVDRVHGALTAALGDVSAEVTSLVGSSWRGAAASAFQDGYDEWERGARQVLEALVATGSALDATRADYLGVDDAAADVLDRLGARLGGGT